VKGEMSSEDQQEEQKETVWVFLFDVEGLNSSVLDGDTVVAKVEFMPNADLEGVDKELADLIGQLNLSGKFAFLFVFSSLLANKQ